MQGWIKVYRDMIHWGWYKDLIVKSVFLHLLLSANHSEQMWQGYIIKRGQLITSTYHLAENLGLSREQIRRALKKLERTKEITVKTTHKNSIITIEKYDLFQGDEVISNPEATQYQPSNNPEATTNKNEKKVKKEKNENKLLVIEKFRKPSIDEIREYILEKNYNVDPEYFYNYYEANGWRVGKNKMKSWKACLVTWNKKGEQENKIYKPKYNNYEQRIYHDLDSLYANVTKEF